MNTKILKIKLIEKIQFKKPRDFCESIETVGSNLYFCTNNNLLNKYILYKYNLKNKKTRKIFEFPSKTIILGSKINSNIFVGCVTSSNSIIILNLSNKKIKYIELGELGCPNDICFDSQDNNLLWVVSNRNVPGSNGTLLKINIKKSSVENIDLGFLIESVSGINNNHKYIYMACLTKIYQINKNNFLNNKIITQDPVNKFFYDNISIYKNMLNIAIFDYDNYISYLIITNKLLYYIGSLIIYLIIGDITILNKININRTMSKSIIRFVKFNVKTSKLESCYFNKPIDNFDKTVTQINQISNNKYILVNWKANYLCVITVK